MSVHERTTDQLRMLTRSPSNKTIILLALAVLIVWLVLQVIGGNYASHPQPAVTHTVKPQVSKTMSNR